MDVQSVAPRRSVWTARVGEGVAPHHDAEAGREPEQDADARARRRASALASFIDDVVAAVIAIPLAVGAATPQMSSDAFVSAVSCTAYEDVTAPNADVGVAKFRLNGEATRQPAVTVAEAHKAASEIAQAAVASENSARLAQRACQGLTAASHTTSQRDA